MADTAVEEKKETSEEKTQAQSAEFPEVSGSEASGGGGSIDILLDMEMPVTIVIGKKKMLVREILQLGPGSVLKLDKTIDSPVDIYLKDSKFASGSVVVVEGMFALKIEQIFGIGSSTDIAQD